MPKNNGRARKAWRKALADHNKRFWDKYGDCGTTVAEAIVDYPTLARGTKPDTAENAASIQLLKSIFAAGK